MSRALTVQSLAVTIQINIQKVFIALAQCLCGLRRSQNKQMSLSYVE